MEEILGMIMLALHFGIMIPVVVLYDYAVAVVLNIFAVFFGIMLIFAVKYKKGFLARFLGLLVTVFTIGGVAFVAMYPTDYPYIDLWVFGKTENEIIEVYGEPRYNNEDGLIYPTEYFYWDQQYYVITFNKNGRAIYVEERIYVPKGG